MKIEFLLSFKNNKELQKLDESFIKSLSGIFNKSFSKKVKKKIVKPVLKCNLLKNNKLQTAKNKTENKMNLILNKLSKNNFNEIIEEFLTTFSELEQEDYNIILQTLYIKILKDEKFMSLFYKFYVIINNIYRSIFYLSNELLINLIETKVNYDYNNIELDENMAFLASLDKEEHRINNLNLIIYFIESNNFKDDIIKHISKTIVKTNFIPDINFWFFNKIIKNYESVENYHNILKGKLNDELNNRYSVILKNLLDHNNISYESDSEEDDDNICDFNIKEDKIKSDFEVEIDNIMEEFILLEDFEEVKSFIDNFKNEENMLKIFTSSLFNFYFNNNLSNLSKFKNLFVNIKKNKLIKSEILKTSLHNLLNNEGRFDYLNLDLKIEKIIEIFKIIQVKLNKNYIKNIKELDENNFENN